MRVLLLALVLLAGCAEYIPEEPEDARLQPMSPPPVGRVIMAPAVEEPAGAFLDGDVVVADAAKSFHGRYRLTIDHDGIWCEAAAGPDAGSIGIVNTCSLQDLEGAVLAKGEAHQHDFRMLLLDAPPQRFVWALQVSLLYEEENRTTTRPHDAIRRTVDLAPEAAHRYAINLTPGCDRLLPMDDDPHRLIDLWVESRNGWPFIALQLDEATVVKVETDGDARIEGHHLYVRGDFGGSVQAAVWIDGEAGPEGAAVANQCGVPVTLGFHAEVIDLRFGTEGIMEGWQHERAERMVWPVHLVP